MWWFFGLVLFYAVYLGQLWYQVTYPDECPFPRGSKEYRGCFEPLITTEDMIDMYLYVGVENHVPSKPIWSTFSRLSSESFDEVVHVPLPNEVRLQGAELNAWILITTHNITSHKQVQELQIDDHGNETNVLVENKHEEPDPARRLVIKATLTKMLVPSGEVARKLLESNANDIDNDNSLTVNHKEKEKGGLVNHWKYAYHPLTIRAVHFDNRTLYSSYLDTINLQLHTRRVKKVELHTQDENENGNGNGNDISKGNSKKKNYQQNVYEPLLYVDDLSLQRRQQIEISTNTSRAAPWMKLQYKPTVPAVHAYKNTMKFMIEQMKTFGLGDSEIDELRYWMSDSRLTRYLLTQLITFVHIFLEYMAFRDDWKFFVGRKSFTGVSSTSVFFSAIRSVVIFLYLLDADTSWIVLFTLGKDILWTFYKLYKVAKPRLHIPVGSIIPKIAYLETDGMSDADAKIMADADAKIMAHDSYATLHVSLAVYPLVGGLAAYSLMYQSYTSWWSWFIGSLADSVYFFGFIAMCPQLYINYKMRSVAHLPVAAFGYKIFNTFIDDVFAFIIKMPLKHRLMTLRDDVVFLGFIYQWWSYRTDKSRVNEFGFKFDESEEQLEDATNDATNAMNKNFSVNDALDEEEEVEEDETEEVKQEGLTSLKRRKSSRLKK
jgi:hypothetical protein